MINTIFSDEIVNSSDLRNNQKHWFEVACEKPITINFGRKQLAVINREELGNLYTTIHFMEMVLKVCEELEKEAESRTLPWINSLTEEDKTVFSREFKDTALHAVDTGNWTELEFLLEDWKATAEVENHPELKEALMKDSNTDKRVRLEE
jgi:hypothetical protein